VDTQEGRAHRRRGRVAGLRAIEVPTPIGNQLNDNLLRELLRTGTLEPADLTRLDDWADE
jgi:hypothetical protein